ncbi:hypothetical protein TTHERM_00023910 (macronuclear) [Tetrahymena thermophila SB210]|uniref:F5/8 type C domain protein n=1 Tax=Tetrahymena thermophila (strain SB210) TaxID=312017 RepID=Q22R90_TETTS|nr:hypothetical protein TTHERM_00023910 [Tetrahymena thermophila SB210]EAR88232.2 hypothetical protein TTHERM_00023910 [Tetrahymena thermophila SB210]|eukprot:XP_001008477.2 hypothetical protein TTHERM_00023910 [Tetrahymena thermophila SB210]
MDSEEIQQIQAINFISEQNNAKVISCSSELKNAQAANIISANRKSIWMTEEGMPQSVIIDISKLADRPKFFKCVAFDCWHDYKTNPSIIEFLVSTDNVKEYITWSTIYLELKEGLQVFQIDPLGRRYDFIKIIVKETYGGAKTYLNQVLLFEENPFGNKQPASQQQIQSNNSQALLMRNKSNAQDLSMNIESEIDEKFFNQARLNIPRPFPNQMSSSSSNNLNIQSNIGTTLNTQGNTLNTQPNSMITQTNQTLPDQNLTSNILNQPHPANLPSISYPSYNNSDRRLKHNNVNSIKKRSLVSSPSEELLHYQGNVHQSGNNTQQSLAMNGQFFHTPSHSNYNLNSNHNLQSNQMAQQPLDSIQKQLYNIQQQSMPGSSAIQSVRGMNSFQQNQPQIMNTDLDQIQQNLNLKLQNMNKEIMQLQNEQPSEVIMDNSSLTPVNQDNYAELQKQLFGQPNVNQQNQLQREPNLMQVNSNSNNNLFEKVNNSGYKQINLNQQDGGQLVSNKTSQISQINNNAHNHNNSQHSNINANILFEDSNQIPSHLLTQSEKEVLALKKMVQSLKEENSAKDHQIKKLEQIVQNLQYTCQNLVEKVESLENKFENFKQQFKTSSSYRRTTQTEERDDEKYNQYVLETNQKQNFPLNSPQTFGKNYSHHSNNYANNNNSAQKYGDHHNQTEQDILYEQYDSQNDKINKLIEQKLEQFQKVIVNTMKKNILPQENEQQEYQSNAIPVRGQQNSQLRPKQQTYSQQENFDKQRTNKSRQNSSNSRQQKTQDYYQPPSFNQNSRSDSQSYQRQSFNQNSQPSYTNKNMGNRSNSNHSQQNIQKSYRSISKQNQQDYHDINQVPLQQVQSNKQFNTEPNRNRTDNSSNPRVVKLLEKLQEKLTIRQKKVEQLNSGKKSKKDYYDRDFDDISDIQDGISSGHHSRLFE